MNIATGNMNYLWLMIVPGGLWIFHFMRAIRGRSYPWVSLCLTVAISVILINVSFSLIGFYGFDRMERWPSDPVHKSIDGLSWTLYFFLLALLPLEGLVALVWVIRRRFRNSNHI